MIDIRPHPERLPRAITEAQRSRPPRAVLVERIPDDAEVVDGWYYVNGVPLTTDPKVTPPPKPKPPPEPQKRDLEAERSAMSASLTQEVEDAIDSAYTEREQTTLLMDLSELDRLIRDGYDLRGDKSGSLLALVLAMEWVKAMRRYGALLEDAVEAAKSVAELDAIQADFRDIGPAPAVRSRDTRAALDLVQS